MSYYSGWNDCKGRCFAVDWGKVIKIPSLTYTPDYLSPVWIDRAVAMPDYVAYQISCPPNAVPPKPGACDILTPSAATQATTIQTPQAIEVPIVAKGEVQITYTQSRQPSVIRTTPTITQVQVTPETISAAGPPLAEVPADWSLNWGIVGLVALGVVAFLALDR